MAMVEKPTACSARPILTRRTAPGVVMLTNGCQNQSMHNGVGMLGSNILTLCYELVIGPDHQVENPFEVR